MSEIIKNQQPKFHKLLVKYFTIEELLKFSDFKNSKNELLEYIETKNIQDEKQIKELQEQLLPDTELIGFMIKELGVSVAIDVENNILTVYYIDSGNQINLDIFLQLLQEYRKGNYEKCK
jgi:hypothetical protein